jgi:hypothetical protein
MIREIEIARFNTISLIAYLTAATPSTITTSALSNKCYF